MRAIKYMIEEATEKDSLDTLSHKELEGLIIKIYAEANSKIEEEMREENFTTLEVEAAQDITINCYEELYEYMPNHTAALEQIRRWAKEFEEWWQSMDEEEQDKADYSESIDEFCCKKMHEDRYKEIRGKLSAVQAAMDGWRCTTDSDEEFRGKIQEALKLIEEK